MKLQRITMKYFEGYFLEYTIVAKCNVYRMQKLFTIDSFSIEHEGSRFKDRTNSLTTRIKNITKERARDLRAKTWKTRYTEHKLALWVVLRLARWKSALRRRRGPEGVDWRSNTVGNIGCPSLIATNVVGISVTDILSHVKERGMKGRRKDREEKRGTMASAFTSRAIHSIPFYR